MKYASALSLPSLALIFDAGSEELKPGG